MTSSDIVAKIRAEKNSNIDTLILEASNVEISNNIGLIIPVGTTLDRESVTPRKGAIRFNSSDTAFEGYDGINWGTLGGVKDVSQTTFIRAETSPDANNKQLDFITDNKQRMQIDSNGDLKFGDISNTSPDIKFSIDYQSGDVSALKIESQNIVSNQITVNNLLSTQNISAENILPKTDMTYDLGSSNNSWDKLYLQNSINPASDSGIYLNGEKIMYMDTNGDLKIGTSSGKVKIPGNFDVAGTTGLASTAQNNAIIAGGNIFGTIIGQDFASGAQSRERALFSTIDVLNNSLFQNHITINKDIKIKFANNQTTQVGSDITNPIDGIFNTIDVSTNSIFRGDLDISNHLTVFGDVSLNNNVDISNHLTVFGDVSLNDNVDICGNLNIKGGLAIDNSFGVSGSTLISQGPNNKPIWRSPAFASCYDTRATANIGKNSESYLQFWGDEFTPVGIITASRDVFKIPTGKSLGYYNISWQFIINTKYGHLDLMRSAFVRIYKTHNGGTDIVATSIFDRGNLNGVESFDHHIITLCGTKVISMNSGDYIYVGIEARSPELCNISDSFISIYQIA